VPQNLIRKPSHLKKSGHFSNLEKKNLCVKKKVLQPKFKKKNQNLVLRVWFALLNYKKNTTIQNLDFSWPFFYQFSCLSKPKNFLSKCQNIKKEKKQPCVYIRKEEKTNQKTSIAPAAVISQKKTSL